MENGASEILNCIDSLPSSKSPQKKSTGTRILAKEALDKFYYGGRFIGTIASQIANMHLHSKHNLREAC
jgi:hypothetical protein